MKIIKEGDLEKLNKSMMQSVIFECERCGCKFEATREEYELKVYYGTGDEWLQSKCPFCENMVRKDV